MNIYFIIKVKIVNLVNDQIIPKPYTLNPSTTTKTACNLSSPEGFLVSRDLHGSQSSWRQ